MRLIYDVFAEGLLVDFAHVHKSRAMSKVRKPQLVRPRIEDSHLREDDGVCGKF